MFGNFICKRRQGRNGSTADTTNEIEKKSISKSSMFSLRHTKDTSKNIAELRSKTAEMVEGRVAERRRQVREHESSALKKNSSFLSKADTSLSHQI